jgi:hypothetical protein
MNECIASTRLPESTTLFWNSGSAGKLFQMPIAARHSARTMQACFLEFQPVDIYTQGNTPRYGKECVAIKIFVLKATWTFEKNALHLAMPRPSSTLR